MTLFRRLGRYLHLQCRSSSSTAVDNCSVLSCGQQTHNEEFNEAVLYVHWPYCARRCTYCNFNKYISKSVDHARMADCLARETQTLLELSGVTKINSVFFGGGTPSLALPSTISRVIEAVSSQVTFTQGSEVTLEANPTHLESDKLRDFKAAGVNRLSLGIQAMNDTDLKLLGRDHSIEEAFRCLEEAKSLYKGHVSVDVIFGRPGQTREQWIKELNEIVAVCDDHVSLYQLTLERGTQLFKWVQQNVYTLPDNDTMADMYDLAVQVLESLGLKRYEVSNFAKKDAESGHNLAYWQGSQYLGVGPGAHGRFTTRSCEDVPVREARIQTLEPDNWMYEVQKYGHATRKVVRQSLNDRLEELLSLGLRTTEGVSHERWCKLGYYGDLKSIFSDSTRVAQLIQDDLLQLDDRGLRVTARGMPVLDSIVPHLLMVLSQTYTSDSVM